MFALTSETVCWTHLLAAIVQPENNLTELRALFVYELESSIGRTDYGQTFRAGIFVAFARFLRFELLDSLVVGSTIRVPECSFSRITIAGLPPTDPASADVAGSAGRITAALAIAGELEDCELKAPINW